MQKKHNIKKCRRKLRRLQNTVENLNAERITITLPADARMGDELEAVSLCEPYPDWQTTADDMCIVYRTDGIQQGDVVCIVGRNEEFKHIGVLDYDDFYYTLRETEETEAEMYHRTQARILGRVIEVRRMGQPIKTALNLRPIHPASLAVRFTFLAWVIALHVYRRGIRGGAR